VPLILLLAAGNTVPLLLVPLLLVPLLLVPLLLVPLLLKPLLQAEVARQRRAAPSLLTLTAAKGVSTK
jgi:hypothetical protein